MTGRPAIQERLRELFAASDHGAAAVYLFGSVARESDTTRSDVDVAVLFGSPQPATLEGLHLDLEAELERALRKPVQLVVLDTAPVDLVHRVLRDGLLVLDRDRSARIAFEVKARNEYWDLLPYLREYRRYPPRPASST